MNRILIAEDEQRIASQRKIAILSHRQTRIYICILAYTPHPAYASTIIVTPSRAWQTVKHLFYQLICFIIQSFPIHIVIFGIDQASIDFYGQTS
jgi:hypothetical protein